jgi:hypothetical protein
MNGMQYMRPKFTLPASEKMSEVKWDYAFLTKEEFIAKWGEMLYQDFSETA